MSDHVTETVALPGRALTVLRPRDSEALLDEAAFEHEEYLPYWAELWPSGVALARALAGRALRGARVVELGCGLAVPSIAAALAGGRVLATDWSPDAVALAAGNAARNGARLDTLVAAWDAPEALLERGPFDLVVASDVLYERRNGEQLLALLPRLAPEAWIADPGRPAAEPFLLQARARFSLRSRHDGSIAIHRLALRSEGEPETARRR